jgi:hypothetical protein
MSERSELISWIRGEIVGPSRPLEIPQIATFQEQSFSDTVSLRRGPLAWRPNANSEIEEILYFDRETPHRKYGVGLLYPSGAIQSNSLSPEQAAIEATDTLGIEPDDGEDLDSAVDNTLETPDVIEHIDSIDAIDDFEVTSADVRHPSTIGITFCVNLSPTGNLTIRLPQSRSFTWQDDDSPPFKLNGRYESCVRQWKDDQQRPKVATIWRRRPAVLPDTAITVGCSELIAGHPIIRKIIMPEGSPISLQIEIFPREIVGKHGFWLVTIVLRNMTLVHEDGSDREAVLYQTYFEVLVDGGNLEKYPESQRPFSQLDTEEQSLALLYRESATWGIGHGCAAGWDAEPDQSPEKIYADIMPAVEVPSTTPDVKDINNHPIKLSMRLLANLPEDQKGEAWQSLNDLVIEYDAWIQRKRSESSKLPIELQTVALRHIDDCELCVNRMKAGIKALCNDQQIRIAFRLANLSMLLQQIATKQLPKRHLRWNQNIKALCPDGVYQSPWEVYQQHLETSDVGMWRAFQIAFLLMLIDGVVNGDSPDREIVDLIWFPTGGGKTEAYLAVMAFYIFHQRLIMKGEEILPKRDGTNVLMRYTLRMLTTQQFQRAASLICAMEFLRRNPRQHGMGEIPGKRFSLGLWIGGEGSPNNIKQASSEVSEFRTGKRTGNPLVLTECPWCRAEIGRYNEAIPHGIQSHQWNKLNTRGIAEVSGEGPLLLCPDSNCIFGSDNWKAWLPIEVIDERIYNNQPSLIIATADKFAIVAYRPLAGSLFGRKSINNEIQQTHFPPGLIIQDELHLISGPLGTMYAFYEGIFERLCSFKIDSKWTKPKIIASTATIRGAADQLKALYARNKMQLFPSPGLTMGDSFFGTYARDKKNRLRSGRLYLGIHANNYGSVLTTQVRTFSSAFFRPYAFAPDRRDPWWSLLTFYNSIRELGGAKTLFDSDIRSRLKFIFNRENYPTTNRRNLKIVEELTSRLSHAEIVAMIDKLSKTYELDDRKNVDACLASNIIEVGIDIPRLSLMGVVGQPKTTAQYIQVTGRVGRLWWDRPGLILMIYNPSKSRDRSHYEQFHSYHRRLYERVEPTSATPFALSAIQRALPGAFIAWARQNSTAPVYNYSSFEKEINIALDLLETRCKMIQETNGSVSEDLERSLKELIKVCNELKAKWGLNPQQWEQYPPDVNGEYLMLWPGQYATLIQKQRGVVVASSMRQVDGSAELNITQGYTLTTAQEPLPKEVQS